MNKEEIPLNHGRHTYLPDFHVIINSEIKEHFLNKAKDKKIKIEDKKIHPFLIQSKILNLNQVIFEVTQDCDLKCKYCIYGDAYHNQRRPAPRDMELQTAKKGIDKVYQIIKNREKREFSVGFFGGEPLLRFDLIKRSIAYAKKVFSEWNLNLFITTNMTILNPEIIKFLFDQKINLNVSLDGPKDIHDAKRVFSDGSGSFDLVIKNLKEIKRINEEYFKNISFTAVYSNDLSIRKVYDFFVGSELLNQNAVLSNWVNKYETDYYERYPYDKKEVNREIDEILDTIMDKARRNKELTIFDQHVIFKYQMLGESLIRKQFTTLANTCLFDSRLYIDVDGKFHVCEKINHKFPFGDVEEGVDFDRATQYINDFAAVNKKICNHCEIRFLCERCIATLASNGIFEPDQKLCDEMKIDAVKKLENYIKLHKNKVIKNEG